MGSIENTQINNWGHSQVNNAQKELDGLNTQIAEVGADAALTACSSVPGYGIACDFASLGKSVYQGDWLGAALDLVGFVPVVGDAIKGGVRGSKILKTMDDLTGAVSAAQAVINKSRRVLSQGTGAIRSAAKNAGELMNIRKGAASNYWRKQVRDSDAYKKYREQIKNCPSASCKRKAREEFRQNMHKNIPRTGGSWQPKGAYPGHGKWVPDEETPLYNALHKTDANGNRIYPDADGIQFTNGHPDFSPFVKKGTDGRPMSAEIPNMQGNHDGGVGDYGQARNVMRERYGTGKSGFRSTVDEDGFTWHHNKDGTTMELIDTDIHGSVPHQGGASMMRDTETF